MDIHIDGGKFMADENLRAVYQELCTSYRAIDDFRAKLLGFLPLATGTGVVLLSDALTDEKKRDFTKQFLGPIGAFGVAITLGLLFYELYGIKKCDCLIKAGKQIEGELGKGQFTNRPREVVGFINEPFAASVIYPAVLATWMYLAVVCTWPQSARWIAIGVFLGGFAVVCRLNLLLKKPNKSSETN
jgi:hypothetical protein